jgi:DIS3-like exonuclease 2
MSRVHIADVSYFLREGTLLDIEARRRATSIYLVQKVIPMLPSILCEQLCSLNPNVDRLAFSCIYVMKPDGNLTEEPPFFGRTVIRSCAKLDYATAQRMIEGIIPSSPDLGPDPDSFLSRMSEDIWEKNRRPVGHAAWECSNDVCLMNSIAQMRRVVRMSNGALVIRRPKMSFRLDDDGNPSAAADYPIRESNNLVEEYMLLANFLVAQEMLSRNGKSAFLRQHSPPDGEKLDQVKASINKLGIVLDTSSSRGLHQSILQFSREGDSTINSAISQMLMSTLNPALYIVAGDEPPQKWAHYALGIPYYTHFTSPIRR